jgi:hypothetical protein
MRLRNDRSHTNGGARKGEGAVSHSWSNEHTDVITGSILTFPSRGSHTETRVLPYGAWLTDARLSSLGFSAQAIRAIRRGEPVGRVLRSQVPVRHSRIRG